jgi:hypothetical protein
MTDRMRKALELIASGEGPQGGRLGYDQMREIAQNELTVLAASEAGIRISDGMADLMLEAMAARRNQTPAIPENLEARLPGYVVDDLLK